MGINNSDLFNSIEEILPGIMENLRDGCIYDGFCDIMGKRICWSSNNLEGNTLSLEETVELIDFDAVRSGHTYTEYREAMNLFGAIQEFLFKLLEEKHQLVYKPRGLGAPLTVISRTCVENGLPPISSIVVLKRDEGNVGLPAKEFYDKFYPGRVHEWKDMEDIFGECKSEVMNCGFWKDLLDSIEQ